MARGVDGTVGRCFAACIVVAAAAVACGKSRLNLEGDRGLEQAGGSNGAAGAESAGGGSSETGGGNASGGTGASELTGSSGESASGNGARAGNAASTPDVIPPPVSAMGLSTIQIAGEGYGSNAYVSFVGDLDGDGYDELAVMFDDLTDPGPPAATASGTDGVLYVFYGRDTFPGVMSVLDADLTIYGGANLGSIGPLGDLDGDGYG